MGVKGIIGNIKSAVKQAFNFKNIPFMVIGTLTGWFIIRIIDAGLSRWDKYVQFKVSVNNFIDGLFKKKVSA